MAIIEPIKVTGLAEFNRNLRKLNTDLPKVLRIGLNESAQLVVDWAQPRVERRSGRAARSIKAKSTRTAARVIGGGPRVPYYPWLDFAGKVGPKRSVQRPLRPEGRHIYPGLGEQRDEIHRALVNSLINVADSAGIEVSNG